MKTLLCMPVFHDSLSFLSADAGVALDSAGETDVEGGEAGFSASPDPNPASRLNAFAEVVDSFSFC